MGIETAKRAGTVLEIVGDTPLVRLSRLPAKLGDLLEEALSMTTVAQLAER